MRAPFGHPGGDMASLLAGPRPTEGCFAVSIFLGRGGGDQAQLCGVGLDIS